MIDNRTIAPDAPLGDRIRRLRLALGLSQLDLGKAAHIASGVVSMIENDHYEVDASTLRALSEVLDVQPTYLRGPSMVPLEIERPKLRAYADASQKSVDRTTHDSIVAVEAILLSRLRLPTDALPLFDGDLSEDAAIDHLAADVRSAAGLDGTEVIPNVVRAAERLGCVVLPLDSELGRHLGLSCRVDTVPVIRVSRPSLNPQHDVPGDRQRFTVAHELGHLVLHAGRPQPTSPEAATRMENQAHRFAAAFLTPGDAVLEDLEQLGGRVTLATLASLKQKWGYAIKAFIMRFQQLGVIDEAHARSLYKQISSRRWNKDEPYRVGTESAMWMRRALEERYPGPDGLTQAARATGIGERYFERWLTWEPSGSAPQSAVVTQLNSAPKAPRRESASPATVTRLPHRG